MIFVRIKSRAGIYLAVLRLGSKIDMTRSWADGPGYYIARLGAFCRR